MQVHVSMEALKDALPELLASPALEQFAASRNRFMMIALKEIKRGSCEDGNVLVKTRHLSA